MIQVSKWCCVVHRWWAVFVGSCFIDLTSFIWRADISTRLFPKWCMVWLLQVRRLDYLMRSIVFRTWSRLSTYAYVKSLSVLYVFKISVVALYYYTKSSWSCIFIGDEYPWWDRVITSAQANFADQYRLKSSYQVPYWKKFLHLEKMNPSLC